MSFTRATRACADPVHHALEKKIKEAVSRRKSVMNVIVKSVIVPNLPSAKNGKMCEDCVEKWPSFGLVPDHGSKWNTAVDFVACG